MPTDSRFLTSARIRKVGPGAKPAPSPKSFWVCWGTDPLTSMPRTPPERSTILVLRALSLANLWDWEKSRPVRPRRRARSNRFRPGSAPPLPGLSAPISCLTSIFPPPSPSIRRLSETLTGGKNPRQKLDLRWDPRWGCRRSPGTRTRRRKAVNSRTSLVDPGRNCQVSRPTACHSLTTVGSRNLIADFAVNLAAPERTSSTTNFSPVRRSRRPAHLLKI